MDTSRIRYGLTKIKEGVREIESAIANTGSLGEAQTPAHHAPVKTFIVAPGHSKNRGGYPGRNGVYSEHDCTVMISKRVQHRLVMEYRCRVDLYDPEDDNLALDGSKAKGYDAYIAPHLNAYDSDDVDEYTCVLAHPNKRNASIQLANNIAFGTWKRLQKTHLGKKAKLFSPNARYPGVYFRGVTVLKYAEKVTSEKIPCVLPESFFLDAYTDPVEVKVLCMAAADGIVDGLVEYFDLTKVNS